MCRRFARLQTLVFCCELLSFAQGTEPTRQVPYAGPLGTGQPPPAAAPPPRPLTADDKHALHTLYKRPGTPGPAAVPRVPALGVSVVGKGVVFRILPGPHPFPDKVPAGLREAEGHYSTFSNNISILPGGQVRFTSIDRTKNDTGLSKDWMGFDATFTDEEGSRWRVLQSHIAPLSPDPVTDPWYGGVIIDAKHHGQLMRGHPGHPLINCAMCSWGWADVWKNDKRVASSALLHVMLSSRVHDPAAGYKYTCYDCTAGPQKEVHMEVVGANLPTPGGFLHVMWSDSDVTRGTAAQISANPVVKDDNLPTLTLNAVPTIRWSNPELKVKAGQRVKLILNNMDPSSFHGFMMRGPDGDVNIPLEQGSQWVTTLVFDQPGEYEFWCPVSNHRGRGMYGRVIVSSGVPGGTQGPPGTEREK